MALVNLRKKMHRTLFILIAITFAATIFLPIHSSIFVLPKLLELHITESEHLSRKIANHYQRIAGVYVYPLTEDSISLFKQQRFRELQEDFDLDKVVLFANDGTILFSSDSTTIGTRNEGHYFRKVVESGKLRSKYLIKQGRTLDGEICERNIIETYVPITHNGDVLGVIEIYHNVTEQMQSVIDLVTQARLLIFAVGVICILLIIRTSMKIIKLQDEDTLTQEKTFERLPITGNPTMVLILFSAALIFIQIFTMYIAHRSSTNLPMELIFGGVLLVLILSPIFYLFFFKPMIDHITDKAILEKQLCEARDAAESSNRAKSSFLANMSHEIRTPMSAVIGMSQLLKLTELDREQVSYVETILSSGDLLLSIINNILDISKIESGRMYLEEIPFDLRLTMDNICMILHAIARDNEVDFECIIDHDVPALLIGDPVRLKQVLINIGNNALKFADKGQVQITIDLDDESDKTAFLTFAIKDNGIGIPVEKRNTIFEPFEQTDRSNTRIYGGSGLGLSIAHHFVKLMGGDITVKGYDEWSTIFTFTIGFQKQKELQAPRELIPLTDKKVLLISDSIKSRTALIEELTYFGMSILTLHISEAHGEQLHHLLTASPEPDLVILDQNTQWHIFPGRQDFVRSILEIKEIPLMLIAGSFKRGDSAECIAMGASGYLSKPYKSGELRDTISILLGQEVPGKDLLITRHTLSEERKRRLAILIVDDNETNLKVAKRSLMKYGFSPDTSNSGEDALDKADKKKYDLIFMDIQMPHLDGYQTSKMIRRMELQKDESPTPIIALTAAIIEVERSILDDAGMDGVLAKPFAINDLLEAIANHTGESSLQDLA